MKKTWILIPILAVILAFATTVDATAEVSDSPMLHPTPDQTRGMEPTKGGGKDPGRDGDREPTRGGDRDGKDKKDYQGTIAAVDSASLTLTLKDGSSVSFLLTADTKVSIGGKGRDATVADLKVGDEATVQAKEDDSGALVAVKIDVKSAKQKKERYSGTVTEYQEGAGITIQDKGGASQSFLITADTRIKFDPKDEAKVLAVGSEVDIVAQRDSSGGTLTAEEITVKKQKQEKPSDYRGTIAAVDAGSLTLTLKDGSSLVFVLTADTKVSIGGKGHDASVADLKVGDEATVQAKKDDSGALVAIKVDVKSAKQEKERHSGTVTDYQEGVSITIQEKDGSSLTFLITADTKIKYDRKDKEKTLEVGSEVTILAVRNDSGGTPTAEEITVRKHKAQRPEHYKGTIAAVDAGSLTLTLKDGSSLVFALTADTKIDIDGLGRDATVADLKAGDEAAVQAKKDDSGAWVAVKVDVKIKVEHYAGTVTDYQPGVSITIQVKDGSSLTFLITPDTRIRSGKEDAGGAPAVGSEVTVVALPNPEGGDPTAKEIVVHPAQKNYRGTIAAVDSGSLTLTLKDGSSLVFVLNADTKVKVPGLGREATVADLAAGEYVTVRAAVDEAGALVAGEVQVSPGKPDKVHRVGVVTDYQPGVSITIRDNHGEEFVFLITADTRILPEERAGGLAVGSAVTIITPRDVAGGGLTALAIVVHPERHGGSATPTGTATPVGESVAIIAETAIPNP